MSELDRRNVVAAALTILMSACADRRPAPRPVWVVLRPSPEGYTVFVDEREVELAQLDAVVLAHALTANPNLDEASVREHVGVYFRTEGDVDHHAFEDEMQRVRFQRVAFVAEDRRR